MSDAPLKAMAATRDLKAGHFLFEFNTPGIGYILKQASCDFAKSSCSPSRTHKAQTHEIPELLVFVNKRLKDCRPPQITFRKAS